MKNKTLSEKVYKTLKNDLTYLKIKPNSILQERKIAEEFSISRTPVREAIQRLANEGWVKINSRKNIVANPILEKDVKEIFQFRRIIEPMVIQIILEQRIADLSLINELQNILRNMKKAEDNSAEFINMDQDFHTLLISKINNNKLNKTWELLSDEIIRLGMVAIQKPGRLSNVIEEHQRIIDGLVDTKMIEARKSCIDHLFSTENIIFNSIFSKGVK